MKYILIKLITLVILLFSFLSWGIEDVKAQCTGQWKCSEMVAGGICTDNETGSGNCVGAIPSQCYASEQCGSNECISGGCYFNESTGGSCSPECRAGSSCPAGFTTASGCSGTGPNFGCKSTQRCCKANSCSGGGGGGGGTGPGQCPAGTKIVLGGTRCQTGGCLAPSYKIADCEPNNNGQARFVCQFATCVACTSQSPDSPTLVSPENESSTSSVNVTLQWNSLISWGTSCGTTNEQYSVYMDTSVNPSTLVATISRSSGVTSTTRTNLTTGTKYYWKVRADNGESWRESAVRSFTVLGNQITGTVYNDTTSNCSTANPSNFGGGLGVSWGVNSAAVGAGGTFTINATDTPPKNLVLTGIPANYVCTPGCGSCPRPGVTYPSSGNNFFLTQSRNPWWQAAGAGVYAGQAGSGVTVRSNLPLPTSRLILPGINSIGALVRASTGAPNIGAATQISDSNYRAVSQYKGKKMDYAFFAAEMGVTLSTEDDFAGSTLNQPANDPTKDFWYQEGDASIDQAWTVNAGESYVVFVNGDLQINQDITVATGGFLALIASGGITVAPNVTTIQGLFVMDQLFTTQTAAPLDDIQIIIRGSTVAWGGVSLNRDLGDLNLTTPAERFAYRSDMILNMPEKMKVFALRWQEVAPGTFDN